MIEIDELRKVLDYDPETGVFRWSKGMRTRNAGAIAGSVNDDGYVCIKFKRKGYWAHRIAWAFVYGKWPAKYIDHKDLNRANNVIDNLRESDPNTNSFNSPRLSNNRTGFKGVGMTKSGRYRAGIKAYGKHYNLGTFETPEAAHAEWRKAADKYHGEYARYA